MNLLETYGLKIPQILLPKDKANLKKWSVIACDQYTQDKDYWKKVEQEVADFPSTLKITLPEVYLGDSDKQDRINNINKTMKEYLSNNIFSSPVEAMIYIERTTGYGRMRKGLVTAIDLETYDWKPFSTALIRATEATILDRIPPRMEIRRDAPIELPHIMLLVNDSEKSLVEKTGELAKSKSALYDTDLMMNSGHITGWQVSDKDEIANVENALNQIAKKQTQKDDSIFMFAVGDGNHSLATAKAIWDELKTKNGGTKNSDGSISIPQGMENHNARFALIEIVNIYDEGLTFEPIHRVLFNVENLLEKVAEQFKKINCFVGIEEVSSGKDLANAVENSNADFGFVFEENGKVTYKVLKTNIQELAVSKLQPALDEILADCKKENIDCEIDYIHGTEEVFRLGGKNNATTILLPPIAKDTFFATIANSGPLPRKSFSMGEASEKRFYMECRQL
ncbi:MAG: DUF1015 domain-containing protein [Spirochaetaceae bacterium]|nr:DUF1015 domain-containing protein [Spirochaetaceae bacterium]